MAKMTLDAFRGTFSASAPPAGLDPPLTSLWWMGKGDWKRAHDVINEEEGRDAAWVHAHLHRVEGDLSNAGYWYRRAAREAAKNSLDAEWEDVARAMLAR